MSSWYDKPRDWGTVKQFNVGHLVHKKMQFEQDKDDYTRFSIDRDWLMGYAIPPFQRPIVWEEERMIAFMETLAMKGDGGTWCYNSSDLGERAPGGQLYYAQDLWLIDGQQRITALDRFVSDEYPVFGLFWSQISRDRQRDFLMATTFPAFEVRNKSELELRELYDLKNFGGVPHEEHQRAVPAPKM